MKIHMIPQGRVKILIHSTNIYLMSAILGTVVNKQIISLHLWSLHFGGGKMKHKINKIHDVPYDGDP